MHLAMILTRRRRRTPKEARSHTNNPDLAKASNDVLDGIRTVASLLDNGQLFISSTCTKLIEELPGYRWDDKASDRGVDKPIKDNDDAADSLRYAIYSTRHQWSPYVQTVGVSA